MPLSREEALRQLRAWTTNPSLLNHAQADGMLGREYRRPFVLPSESDV